MSQTRCFRARRSIYVVPLSIIGFLVSIVLLGILKRGPGGDDFFTSFWTVIAILVCAATVITCLVERFRIVVTPEGVSYRAPTRRERYMRFQDMESYHIGVGSYEDETGRTAHNPFYRLVLIDRNSRKIILNLGLMKRHEIKPLTDILEQNGIADKTEY